MPGDSYRRLRTLSTSGTPHIGPLVPTSRLARQS